MSMVTSSVSTVTLSVRNNEYNYFIITSSVRNSEYDYFMGEKQ